MFYDEVDKNEMENYGHFIDIDLECDCANNDAVFLYELEQNIIEYKYSDKKCQDYPADTENYKPRLFLHSACFISMALLFFEIWILGNKS